MHKEELKQQKDLLKAVLKNNEIRVCEYLVKEDKLIIYDEALMVEREIPNYLKRLEQNSSVCPEDLWKMREFLRGRASSGVEVRIVQGKKTLKRLFQVLSFDGIDPSVRVPVIIRDTTRDEYREALLEDRATKDALTMLYNHFFGRELINEYFYRFLDPTLNRVALRSHGQFQRFDRMPAIYKTLKVRRASFLCSSSCFFTSFVLQYNVTAIFKVDTRYHIQQTAAVNTLVVVSTYLVQNFKCCSIMIS